MTTKSKDLNLALRKIGLKKDDNIFCHSNLGFFGRMKDINNKNELCKIFYKNIFEIIGVKGNLIVPTFSYSYFKNENYIINSQSQIWVFFLNGLEKNKKSVRSNDPNFSISCIGPEKLFHKKIAKMTLMQMIIFLENFIKKTVKF